MCNACGTSTVTWHITKVNGPCYPTGASQLESSTQAAQSYTGSCTLQTFLLRVRHWSKFPLWPHIISLSEVFRSWESRQANGGVQGKEKRRRSNQTGSAVECLSTTGQASPPIGYLLCVTVQTLDQLGERVDTYRCTDTQGCTHTDADTHKHYTRTTSMCAWLCVGSEGIYNASGIKTRLWPPQRPQEMWQFCKTATT